jgi:lipopolysaccharide biosynthesis glycosyltransferase
MNIVSSSDDRLAQFIPVQLASIGVNLKDISVDFYLLYHNISPLKLKAIRKSVQRFPNINLHCVHIANLSPYRLLADFGGGWPPETYFSLECHKYLPETADRAFFIDAGDIIFLGCPTDYNSDFEGASLIVAQTREPYKDAPINRKLLKTKAGLFFVAQGYFDSGAYLINLKKFRDLNLSIDSFINLARSMPNQFTAKMRPNIGSKYFGDEGLLSTAFIGDMKFSNAGRGLGYRPFNFRLEMFDEAVLYFGQQSIPDYSPVVIHFAGVPKPWTMPDSSILKPAQIPYFNVWNSLASESLTHEP